MSLLKFIGAQNALSNQVGIGMSAIVGPTGAQGWQGWQGYQGAQGAQGFQGFQGTQGSQGWQGSVGYQGAQGWQGISGFSTNTGATGPQGWQGLIGYQGVQGVQGYMGPTGTVNFQSGTFQTLNADTFYVTNVTMPSGSKINSPYDTVFIDGHLNVSNIFTVSGINSNVKFCNFTGGAMIPNITINGVSGKLFATGASGAGYFNQISIGPSMTGTLSVSSLDNRETVVLGYNPTPGQSPWYHNFYSKQLALLGNFNTGYNMAATGYTGAVKLYIGNYNNDLPESQNMYPIVCEDENGYVDFFIKAQTVQGALDSVAYFGGKVGIGVTGPINKLDVLGGVVIGSYAGVTTGPVNGLLVSGKVGIGTQEDSNYFLTVGGNQILKSTSNPGIVLYNTALTKQWILGGAPTDRYRIDYWDGGAEYEYLTILPGGNIGIGINNPSLKLHISGSTNSAQATYLKVQNALNQSNGAIFGQDASNNVLVYNQANANMIFATNNTERMRISPDGNFGVGYYPWFPISIGYNGTGTATGGYKYNFGLEIYNNYVSPNYDSNVTNCIVFTDQNSVQGAIGGYRKSYPANYVGGLVFLVGNQPSGYNQSRPSTQSEASKSLTEAMRITPDLNVGIGTTSPQTKLNISGGSIYLENGSLNGITRSVTAGVTTNEINGGSSWGADAGQLRLSAGGGTSVGTKAFIDLYGYNTQLISFGTAGSEQMRLNGGGNLGLGTSNPFRRLDVTNSSNDSYIRISSYNQKALEFYDLNNSAQRWVNYVDGQDTNLRWYNPSANRDVMILDTNGSIAHYGLHSIIRTDNDNYANGIFIKKQRPNGVKDGNELGYLIFEGTDNSSTLRTASYMISTAAGDFTSSNAAANINFYSCNLNTVTPVLRAQFGYDGRFRVFNPTSSNGAYMFLDSTLYSSGGTYWALGSSLSSNIGVGKFEIGNAGGTRMVITDGGNVGIGTTSPSSKLHVNDQNAGDTIQTQFKTSWSNDWDFRIDQHHIGGSRINYYLRYNYNGTLYNMLCFDTENVGIGTQYPAAKLDVTRSSQPTLFISQTDYTSNPGSNTDIGILRFKNQSDANDKFCDIRATVRTSNYEPSLTFWTKPAWNQPSATEAYLRMIITEYGNVGIGTNNPESALHIVGNKNYGTPSAGIHFGQDNGNGNYSIEICGSDVSSNPYLDFTTAGVDSGGRILLNNTKELYFYSNIYSGWYTSLVLGNKVYSPSNDGWPSYISVQAAYGTNMLANEYRTYSDSRIKTNINPLNKNYCLDVVNSLNVVTYEYTCSYMNSSTGVVGFIAQEVQAVDPNCVTITGQCIPNINQQVELTQISIIGTGASAEYIYSFGIDNELIDVLPGIQIDFIANNKRNTMSYKVESYEDHTMTVRGSPSLPSSVFCLGTMVDDFHILDKPRLYTYSIGAIQELSNIIEAQKLEIETLKEQRSELIQKMKSSNTWEEFLSKL